MENDRTPVTEATETELQTGATEVLEQLPADESLIEEVSIDGMCGVY